ncbi:MAG TPA: serine/threonine-protein kinase, partial [Polyangiaceae bacterium]|nr:serine/threonine-protein kinase [Polyangiaceae bacterium]
MSEPLRSDAPAQGRIANRYDVLGRLGRGGMAVVYRVRDAQTGCELALKQLRTLETQEKRDRSLGLFEREFHTLAQLAHPRVIAVYDYGLDEAGPYYTMELLDGGDLLDRSPLPWREACRLLLDVCSSLALLHSRRLLHRDVSPRNVRCTRDGSSKLIDFGAMTPMPGGGAVVGTPAFCAPESLQRSALDARADLFSLGATLYYALTGRMAYPAQSFAEMLDAFARKPSPPSTRVADIPPALDELVLSLLATEPALRPRSAYEVMQRLSV